MQHSRSKRFISCVSWHASFVDTTISAFKRGEDVAEYPLLDSLIGGFLRLHVMKIVEKNYASGGIEVIVLRILRRKVQSHFDVVLAFHGLT